MDVTSHDTSPTQALHSEQSAAELDRVYWGGPSLEWELMASSTDQAGSVTCMKRNEAIVKNKNKLCT